MHCHAWLLLFFLITNRHPNQCQVKDEVCRAYGDVCVLRASLLRDLNQLVLSSPALLLGSVAISIPSAGRYKGEFMVFQAHFLTGHLLLGNCMVCFEKLEQRILLFCFLFLPNKKVCYYKN